MLGHITVHDINEALGQALPMLLRHGKRHTAASVANQRPTLEWPGIFITEYVNPTRNVLFDPVRDANPLFHYLEAMWIIAGRNDVRTLAHILPKMAEYSDDGNTFHGAYGHRLRHWPTGLPGKHADTFDQIEGAIHILSNKPDSRQVVLSIWNPELDLGAVTKDMPCNDMIMLKVRDGALHMTVNNRSNDVIWGCYGANAVQFSMLQMYVAARLNLKVGPYFQVSNSFHVYEDNPYWQWFCKLYEGDQAGWQRHYSTARHNKYPQLGDCNLFDDHVSIVEDELSFFWDAAASESIQTGRFIQTSDFHCIALRNAAWIWNTLLAYRLKDYDTAEAFAYNIPSSDWAAGVQQWLERRADKRKE